jgi:hypothetical protein
LSPFEGRKFALTLGGAFLVLGSVAALRSHPAAFRVLLAVGLAWIVAGLLVPSRLGPVKRGWMAMALAISRVTTPVFLAVIYFLVLTPIGLAVRLFGRNPIRPTPASSSFWKTRDAASDRRGTMRNQF